MPGRKPGEEEAFPERRKVRGKRSTAKKPKSRSNLFKRKPLAAKLKKQIRSKIKKLKKQLKAEERDLRSLIHRRRKA